MPVLANAKHEAFCRFIVDGLKMIDAYERAGYHRSPSAASQLQSKVEIQNRIQELISEKQAHAEDHDDDLDNLPEDLGREWLLKTLMKNIQIAQRAGQISPANKAVEMLAELIGFSFKKPGVNPSAEDEEERKKEKAQDDAFDTDKIADAFSQLGKLVPAKEAPVTEESDE